MNTTAIRAVASVLTLAALVAAGAGAVRAAEPTLGATVETRIFLADSRAIHVLNRSTIPETFTATPTGGYSTDPASMTLAPGQEGVFVVIGDGEDGVKIPVVFTAAGTIQGARGAGSLDVVVEHHRPFDWSFWLVWAGIVAAALVFLYAVSRWVRANIEWSAPRRRVRS